MVLRSFVCLGVVTAFRAPLPRLVNRRLPMASFSTAPAGDEPAPPPPLTRVAWLRSELRVRDNGVLEAAAAGGARVLPVFVFDPAEFGPDARGALTGARKTGCRRANFVVECVSDLREQLAALESAAAPLLVARGAADAVLPAVADALGEGVEVVCAAAACPEETAAEARVAARLGAGGRLRRVHENTMYHPDDLLAHARLEMPRALEETFTPFRTKVEKANTPIRPPRAPAALVAPPLARVLAAEAAAKAAAADAAGLEYAPALAELGFGADEVAASLPADGRGDYFAPVGGETAALARLRRFIWDEDRLRTYFDTRNGMVGQGYSTKLAPWLARGCVSPREVAHACRE